MTNTPVRSNYKKIKYEITNRPWNGPLVKARQALPDAKASPLDPEGFLGNLEEQRFSIFQELSYVRFHRFQNSEIKKYPNIKEYRVAVCYVKPNPLQRAALYQSRLQIARETGWYPLVMGNRARITTPRYKLPLHNYSSDQLLSLLNIGQILYIRQLKDEIIQDSGKKKNGTSILVEGTGGKLLLDIGFAGDVSSIEGIKAVFLSHFHSDHSGGITRILDLSLPIFMSESTFRYLYDNHTSYSLRNKLIRNTIIIEKIPQEIQAISNVGFFPVFHAPGSYGLTINDKAGTSLWYPGDICLRNGFLHEPVDLSDEILKDKAPNR